MPKTATPLAERFWRRVVERPDGCWDWSGARYGNGYGQFTLGGLPRRSALAHRWSYEEMVDPIPMGLDLDHLCGNRLCVNPQHLDPVPHAENIRRGFAARLERQGGRCARGHEYDEANTYWFRDRPHCRACRREDTRRRRGAA